MSGADRAADRTDGACGFDAGDGLRHPLREGRGERRAGAALVCAHREAAHADARKTVFDLRAAEQTERGDDEQRACADRDRERGERRAQRTRSDAAQGKAKNIPVFHG